MKMKLTSEFYVTACVVFLIASGISFMAYSITPVSFYTPISIPNGYSITYYMSSTNVLNWPVTLNQTQKELIITNQTQSFKVPLAEGELDYNSTLHTLFMNGFYPQTYVKLNVELFTYYLTNNETKVQVTDQKLDPTTLSADGSGLQLGQFSFNETANTKYQWSIVPEVLKPNPLYVNLSLGITIVLFAAFVSMFCLEIRRSRKQ